MVGQGYNPSVTAFKSLIAVPAPLTQGRREVRSIAAAKKNLAQGASCVPAVHCGKRRAFLSPLQVSRRAHNC